MGINVTKFTDQYGGRGPRTYVWGKFYSRELINCDDSELLEELRLENENIIEAKRIHRGGQRIRTSIIKVKFNGTTLPRDVYCLGMMFDGEPFIPPVKKCYKCKMYNIVRL